MRTNEELGLKVHENLLGKGIETPFRIIPGGVMMTPVNYLLEYNKLTDLTKKFDEVLEVLGLDRENESLCGTPQRIAKMFLYEIFSGLDYANFPDIMTIPNVSNYDEMVLQKNVDVKSMCEHHFVAIDGHAVVGYIPKELVIGLSKINRIVNFFSSSTSGTRKIDRADPRRLMLYFRDPRCCCFDKGFSFMCKA